VVAACIVFLNADDRRTNEAARRSRGQKCFMKIPEGLARRSDGEIRAELHGFPAPAVEALVKLKHGCCRDDLREALLATLSFYLPRHARRSLADTPDSARLREDLGLDSLALAEAAFKLDDVLGIPVETREVGNLATVGDLLDFFCARLEEAA